MIDAQLAKVAQTVQPITTKAAVTARKKALFVAEGVTLAHVGRSIRLASILQGEGIDVELACDKRYARFLTDLEFPIRSIRSISSDIFLEALARGRPVFSTETLRSYVTEDLSLLGAVQPDVVIGDFRLSLSVSARVAGIPYVNVTNAYWSPYARPHFQIPSMALTRRVGLPLANALFPIARPFAFAVHAIPMNRVRRAYGLPSLGWDVRRVYCDGDLTLYADIPDLIPISASPPTHRYIGPVLWSPPVQLPAWWNDVFTGQSPIYVSLGSSGHAQLLPMVIEALAPLERPIVVATAGRGGQLPHRTKLWVTDFLPGETIAAKACVVVCNGGSPTCQQALTNGVPIIGIASNLDQYLNMDYIERFGAGKLIRSDHAGISTVHDATRRAIDNLRFRERACAVAELAKTTRPELEFPSLIRLLLGVARHTSAELTA